MVDDYYYAANAYLSYWSGTSITTDMLHNGATMGATGDLVADICMRISFKTQIKTRAKLKKSGFAGWRYTEGMLAPVEFTITYKCVSGAPLSWVHASDSDAATPCTHLLTIPTAQQPHISATATTAIPALCLRIERENASNANQRIDLLGCVVEELKLTVEDGGKAQWDVKGKCCMVLAGVAEITNPVADPTLALAVFGWEHFAISALTYNSVAVALTPKAFTATWTLEWEFIAPGTKATSYFVYTNALLKSWSYDVEITGLPYSDGTKVSIYTIARTAIASYTGTGLLLTWALTRTATDYISYSIDKTALEMENDADSNRESSGYEEQTIKLSQAEGSVITASAKDDLTQAAKYYGGAT
jgi:hypothetical protein